MEEKEIRKHTRDGTVRRDAMRDKKLMEYWRAVRYNNAIEI